MNTRTMNGRHLGMNNRAMISQDMVRNMLPKNRLSHSMPLRAKAKAKEKDTGKDRHGREKVKEKAIGRQARGAKEAERARMVEKALGLRSASVTTAVKKATSSGIAQSP